MLDFVFVAAKFLLVFVLLIVLLLFYRFRLHVIPGIPHLPLRRFLGHAMWLKQNLDTFYESELKFLIESGPTHQLCVPGKPANVRTVNPQNIKFILNDELGAFVKSPPGKESFAHDVFGGGIFAVDGEEAKQQRKTASHMFSIRVFKEQMEQSYICHGNKLVSVLENTPQGTLVDMQDLFLRFTMDSFCKAAFGVDLNSLESPTPPPFGWAFDRTQELLKLRSVLPAEVWQFQRRFQCCARERELSTCKTIINTFIGSLIAERNAADLEDEMKWADLLSRFIHRGKKMGEPLDAKKLRDIMLNFVLAGRDTTGCLLAWALVEFQRHPEWEEKCLNEMRDIMGGEAPSHDNVKHMTQLHMFLSECLRLHPPVPSDTKWAARNVTLPDGHVVMKGCAVTYLPYAAGRWAANWGPDVLEFKPERWTDLPLNPDEDRKDFDYKFVTFNAGPRVCLGKSMAYMEAKMCLAQLLPRFRFKLKEGADLSPKISFTLQLRDGLMMYVSPRA